MTKPNPLEQLDLKNMPVREAYRKLDSINKTLGQEKVEALKYELLLPFRKKNMILGLGLVTMVGGIFAFSMYKATPAPFPDLTPQERAQLLKEESKE